MITSSLFTTYVKMMWDFLLTATNYQAINHVLMHLDVAKR